MNKGLRNTAEGERDRGRDGEDETEVEKGKPDPWNDNDKIFRLAFKREEPGEGRGGKR